MNLEIKERLIGLDLFRILSALMIFFFHSAVNMGFKYGYLQAFVEMGAIFMTGFFMLSGFSMFYNYEKKDLTKLTNVLEFYKKRVIGILPLYWLTAALFTLLYGKESILQNIILFPIELLGLQAMFNSLFPITHNGGTWFVSCILLCYICFPFLSELAKQLNTKIKLILIVFLTFILLYSPIIVLVFYLNNNYSNPFFRSIEFIIGALLASILQSIYKNSIFKKVFIKKITIIFEFLLLVLAVTIAIKLQISVGNYMLYSWICLPIFIVMLPGMACIKFDNIKNISIVKYFSSISYAFFLAQFFTWPIVGKIITRCNIQKDFLKIFLSLIICITISIFMHELIEKPFMNNINKPSN